MTKTEKTSTITIAALVTTADRFRDESLDLDLQWAYQEACRQAEKDVAAQIRSELAPTAEESG